MWSVRTVTRIRTSPSLRMGYESTPRYGAHPAAPYEPGVPAVTRLHTAVSGPPPKGKVER